MEDRERWYRKDGKGMIKTYDCGAYLIRGEELIADSADAVKAVESKTGNQIDKAEAKKNTIAYGILKNHNTSDSMEKLEIKFDKLTSHDITYVGIIQTARASGLEKLPHLSKILLATTKREA